MHVKHNFYKDRQLIRIRSMKWRWALPFLLSNLHNHWIGDCSSPQLFLHHMTFGVHHSHAPLNTLYLQKNLHQTCVTNKWLCLHYMKIKNFIVATFPMPRSKAFYSFWVSKSVKVLKSLPPLRYVWHDISKSSIASVTPTIEHGLLDIVFDFWDTWGYLPSFLQVVGVLATILTAGINAGILKNSLRSFQPIGRLSFAFNL